jgi:hypothetical protein
VDGGQLVITKSAYAIIHKRQSWWRDQLIWIDQVCINQDDCNEKASQVQMMEHIYKEVVRVTAYLGEATDAHLVQSLLAKLYFQMKGLGISAEQMKALYIFDSRGPEWNALRHFLRNPWFRRVWIVQEAALAKEVRLLYGTVCMDWEYVSRGVAILNDRHLLEVLRPSDTSSCFSDSFRDSLLGLGNVDTMLEFRRDVN